MNPNLWQLESLVKRAADNSTVISGCWRPCRPYGRPGLAWRLRCAWLVFTGRADAVIWPGEQ